jgi:hypothetical protein
MSRGINWFKDIKIEEEVIDFGLGKEINYSIEYLDGNSTSFSEGNIAKYQDAFRKYGNVTIPYIEYEYYSKPTHVIERFIEPKVLSEVCSKILSDCILDKYDIKSRIEWFKEMSDKGYYFSFDNW